MAPIVTLTTDFGTADGYVGEMKGVLLCEAPGVILVDITHEIPPQDIGSARMLVERCWRRYPRGTIHVVVVDPGVGSARPAIAVESDGRFLVGPDNGVLSAALDGHAKVVELPVPADASATFHGRDVFAPAAARLARGHPLSWCGSPHTTAIVLADPEQVTLADGTTAGEVVCADRFGNAITNIRPMSDATGSVVEIGGVQITVRRTYADVSPGEALALIGSSGRLEIAVRNGHAARTLGIARGARVVLARRPTAAASSSER